MSIKKYIFNGIGLSIISLAVMHSAYAKDINVFVEDSLKYPMRDIIKLYEKKEPSTDIHMDIGASTDLAKKIENGAAADLLLSVGREPVQGLINKKIIKKRHVHDLVENQIVVIIPNSLDIAFGPTQNFKFDKAFKGNLCVGQVESALGTYTMQSLVALEWYKTLKNRLSGAENAAAVLQNVEQQKCQVGIVYKSDILLSTKVKMIGAFPEKTHQPIVYTISLTQQGLNNKAAVSFEHFIQYNPTAISIFKQYGFTVL